MYTWDFLLKKLVNFGNGFDFSFVDVDIECDAEDYAHKFRDGI